MILIEEDADLLKHSSKTKFQGNGVALCFKIVV